MTREEEIEEKCDLAACDQAKKGTRQRHVHFYLYEHWDVHPPAEFNKWWYRQPESKSCKAVTAWNCQADRDSFKRWVRGEPEPADELLTPEQIERGNKFMADLLDRRKAAQFSNVPKSDVVSERTKFKAE